MPKKVYFAKVSFQTYIEITKDFDASERAEVLEAINHLPSCSFEFGNGDDFLPLAGGSSFCQGKISSKEVGKLHEVSFDGWFYVDPKKRRDEAEKVMEKLLKGDIKLAFISLQAGSFVFNAMNSKGKEVENLPSEFEVTTTKPVGIEFHL